MTIDTLEYVKKLEAAGISREQAEAHAQAAGELISGQAATKADLENGILRLDGRIEQGLARDEAKLDREVARLDGRLNPVTWMLGFNLAASVAILFRLLR